MAEILKWLWVGAVFVVLIGGALVFAHWIVQDVTRKPAQTRGRRVKRS